MVRPGGIELKPLAAPLPWRRARRLGPPALLLLVTAACAPAPAATTLPTPTRTPARLGPTSTPAPATPTAIPLSPTPSLPPLPTPSPEDWALGPEEAPVEILLYQDFQCPLCAAAAAALQGVLERHPGEVRLVFRHYPLAGIYDKSDLAALAVEAAGLQGAFWPMHERLFAERQAWVDLDRDGFVTWLVEQAGGLGLDAEQFQKDLLQGTRVDKVNRDLQAAQAAGVPGPPFLLINGRPLRLAPTEINLEAAVRLAALEPRRPGAYPPMVLEAGRQYRAHLLLEHGELVIALFPESAPLAVNSFLYLADIGWYDNNAFYRVLPGVLAETGDPTGTGLGDPGYTLPTEVDPALRFDAAGVVALVASGPDTNDGRFFITLRPMPELDGTRTIFGRVVRGLQLLESLPPREPLEDLLTPPAATIREVWIERR